MLMLEINWKAFGVPTLLSIPRFHSFRTLLFSFALLSLPKYPAPQIASFSFVLAFRMTESPPDSHPALPLNVGDPPRSQSHERFSTQGASGLASRSQHRK